MAIKRGTELPQTKLDQDAPEARYSPRRQRDALRKHIAEKLSNGALAKQFGVHISTVERVLQHEPAEAVE